MQQTLILILVTTFSAINARVRSFERGLDPDPECFTLIKKFKALEDDLNRKIENKINDLEERIIDKIEENILKNKSLDSRIIQSKADVVELMHLCDFDENQKWKLLYRASKHGFLASDFHRKCDEKENTLTIIKTTKGYIFGGYTTATCFYSKTGENYNFYDGRYTDSKASFNVDKEAFIFSFQNKEKSPVKKNLDEYLFLNAIYCNASYGPCFGDFYISNSSNTNNNSWAQIGNVYEQEDYPYDSDQAKNFLAGSKYFQVSEIEVFQKQKIYYY